ncbi:MAG: hypothetical protein J0I06_19220 [Planctomycetes bacterium]|nr:hypothetical protein [Planctomycetota bacterium]
MNPRALVSFFLAALAVPLVAGPVAAGDAGAPVLAASYWNGFIEHWSGVFQKQNGIVMAALLVGAVCLFIITRGKWKK